jgi:hypothetical protein
MHKFSNLCEPNICKRIDESPGSQIGTFLKILKHKWLSGFSDVAFKHGSTPGKSVQWKWSCVVLEMHSKFFRPDHFVFVFASFCLQAHVLSVKSVDSLPLPLIIATFVCCLQWLIYGYILGDPFIQVCNNFQPQLFLGDRIFNPYAARYFFTAFIKECNFKVKICTHYEG